VSSDPTILPSTMRRPPLARPSVVESELSAVRDRSVISQTWHGDAKPWPALLLLRLTGPGHRRRPRGGCQFPQCPPRSFGGSLADEDRGDQLGSLNAGDPSAPDRRPSLIGSVARVSSLVVLKLPWIKILMAPTSPHPSNERTIDLSGRGGHRCPIAMRTLPVLQDGRRPRSCKYPCLDRPWSQILASLWLPGTGGGGGGAGGADHLPHVVGQSGDRCVVFFEELENHRHTSVPPTDLPRSASSPPGDRCMIPTPLDEIRSAEVRAGTVCHTVRWRSPGQCRGLRRRVDATATQMYNQLETTRVTAFPR